MSTRSRPTRPRTLAVISVSPARPTGPGGRRSPGRAGRGSGQARAGPPPGQAPHDGEVPGFAVGNPGLDGLDHAILRPASRASAATAAVTTVLPTSVPVPAITRIFIGLPARSLGSRRRPPEAPAGRQGRPSPARGAAQARRRGRRRREGGPRRRGWRGRSAATGSSRRGPTRAEAADVHAVLEAPPCGPHRPLRLAEDDGHHRRRGAGRPDRGVANRLARLRTSAARSGSAADRSAPGRRQPRAGPAGVEDERPRDVDQVFDHGVSGHDRAALAAERLRQGHCADDVGRAGKAGLVHQAAPARDRGPRGRAPHRRPAARRAAAGRVQAGQRGQIAVDGEHRVGDHEHRAGSLRRRAPRVRRRRRRARPRRPAPGTTGRRPRSRRGCRRRRPPGAPGPDRAVSAPRLAAYPEEKTRARGAARKEASSASNSACSSVLPVTRREPVDPAPHVRSAVTPASTTRGSRASPR